MIKGLVHDQNLEKQIEKQMGCMAGFLQLFDRQQILSGKRLHSTKRLTPSLVVDSISPSEKAVGSTRTSKEVQQQQQQETHQQELQRSRASPEFTKPPTVICSPVPELSISAKSPAKTPLPLQVFDYKEGSRSPWKFKDAPRLSLDSRASFDGKGSLRPREIRTNAAIRCDSSSEAIESEENEKQRRSPSVIARLMGLEALPDSVGEAANKAELRRSASESRVSRDLQYRFVDGTNFQQKQSFQSNSGNSVSNNTKRDNAASESNRPKVQTANSNEFSIKKPKSEPQKSQNAGLPASPSRLLLQQRKSFFDSQDFFPEPKQNGSFYGEIEKRLKLRGIDEPEKDMETLKQILEALQLKGLLHSKRTMDRIGHQSVVNGRRLYAEESPIVVMKSSRSPASINRNGRTGTESPPSSFRSRAGVRRNLNLAGETLLPVTGRNERPEIDRNMQKTRKSRSSDSSDSAVKSPSSLARRKPLSIQTQRKGDDSVEQRRSSPVHSPKFVPRKVGSELTTSRSPRSRKTAPEVSPRERISRRSAEYESSSVSECSVSTSSQLDMELQRSKMEECKEGRTLLERCDELLHSISEITSSELQPSPVSVLDSSFYKDDSPSPVMKRSINLKGELEDDNWSPVVSPVRLKHEEKGTDEDDDYLYVSEIFQAFKCLPEDGDVFFLLERQRQKSRSSSREESILHRKLVFDTVNEIFDRKKQLPPWKAVEKPSLKHIWSEFKRVTAAEPAEDLLEVICGMLRKDMAVDAINGWGNCHVETSEAVLDIERCIFKDLIAETIRDLATFPGKNRAIAPPRRKLVF